MSETFTVTGPDGKPIEVPVPKRVRYVCAECGGTNVMWDAWVEWDEETQQSVIRSEHDDARCDDCDRECEINEVDIEPVSSSYSLAISVNVLCTATIVVTVQGEPGDDVHIIAERKARASPEEAWAIDEGKDFDWATLQVESVELVEPEEPIDTSDIPEQGEEFFKNAKLVEPKRYAYSHLECPSQHWNDGNDVCADCGVFLGDA